MIWQILADTSIFFTFLNETPKIIDLQMVHLKPNQFLRYKIMKLLQHRNTYYNISQGKIFIIFVSGHH